ncbi:hypothetical protein [Pseudoclavibacter sp. VKM Ac-2888]|uniref:hypothetical protein n=1 Tax=Pseudoclavibacter sp. VKM Ac-2888 TaxID=2783830 RepID=UPI00188DA24C|nr:hypothetical protein [Pseudoclavibacter sp. VKM Ac-2888]MBF4549452.1 hypothetical protein [Pseudoclavibacter sp. VKM Ac-2888]
MLAPPEPVNLTWDSTDADASADTIAALRDMLTARAILLELNEATSIGGLPELLRPPRVVIAAQTVAELLDRLCTGVVHLDSLGVEVRAMTPNPTTFDSAIV